MQQINYPEVYLHIGADRLAKGSGGTRKHYNHHTGEADVEFPLAGATEVNVAVEVAHQAFQTWRCWRPAARRDVLMRLANLLEEKRERFAAYTTMDTGFPLAITSQQWAAAKEWIAYYAGFADKIEGEVTSSYISDSDFSYTLREPYGVVGLIVSSNGPLVSISMKAGSALAAGNTIVVKSSEQTPFSLELFMECAREAGIPDGVVNVLPGAGDAGEALVSHPKVRKVSFTGGPVGARKILSTCAQLIKPVVLELGGKSANLIFADADIDFASQHAAIWSVAMLSGQGCAFPTRLLVEDEIYEEVVERIANVAQNIKIGDPWQPDTLMGPVMSEASLQRILSVIEQTQKSGDGRLVTGGKRIGGELAKGFYIEPTVFRDVREDSLLCQQEVFGPVLAVMKFSSEEEAIRLANDTEYGLAAYIQSRDLERVHRVAAQLNAGAVYINGGKLVQPGTPFGGSGLSGMGREGGRYGLDEFLQVKTVQIGSTSGKAITNFP